MLRQIVHAANSLDWITPLAAEIQDLVQGPSYTFLIDDADALSAAEIQAHLEHHGLKVWGLMYDGDVLLLSVPQDKAEWAAYLLQKLGLPLLNGSPAHASQVHRASQGSGGATGLFDWLVEWLLPD
ncbi:MAG: hypothetical protein JXA74_15735 [Anaerolineae bacterium]|nr:hypothetical protein [Anaerolineae bacterium]